MNRISIFLLLLAVSCVAHGQSAAELAEQSESRFIEGEELIMTVRIDNYTFGEVFAVKQADSVHVELEGLLVALDFPIYYDDASGKFEGWFISEERAFSLAYTGIEGDPIVFDPSDANKTLSSNDFTILADTLYISLERLNDWFGLAAYAQFQDQMIYMNPSVKLPFQQRLDRKKQRIRKGGSGEIQYSQLSRGFGLLSPQAIDLQVNSLYSEQRDELNGSYSLLGSRDVALFNTQFFLSGASNDWINVARLQVNKTDENNRLFGINNLSSIEIGDITPVRQSNRATLRQSRGVLIDNLSRSNDINLDATSVSGEIQAGWDVELYRNGVLLGQQFEVQSGRFEFNDIPLDAGVNQLKIVLYGPQGQRVERSEERILDREAVTSGKIKYQASLTQSGSSLFGLEEQRVLGTEDLGYNLSGNVQTRVFGNTALNAGFSSQFGGDEPINLVSLATNTAVANRVILGSSFQYDDGESYQGRVNARGAMWGQNVSAGVAYASSIREDTGERSDRILSQFDISGQLALGENVRLSYRNDLNYTAFETGDRYEFRNSLGFTSSFIDVFNNISIIKPVTGDEQKFGGVSLQKSFGSVMTRLNAGYTFEDSFEFNDVRFDVSWFAFNDISNRFVFRRNIQNKNNDYELQTTWNNQNFSVSGVLRQSDNLGFSAGVNATFSLGGAPLQYNSVFNTINPVASKSSLLVRVFIDNNVNGYFDFGETVVPNVKVFSVQSRMNALTNDQGIAALTNLPPGRVTDITLDYSTVEDPFLVPLIEGVAIKSRAGHIDNLDFPLAIGNEVEGTVQSIDEFEMYKPVGRAMLELVDSNGHVKYETQTEFDGYYLFTGVIAGDYTLRINPDFLQRTRLKTPVPAEISITNETGLLSGMDLIIEEKEFAQGYVPAIGMFSNEKLANFFWQKTAKQGGLAPFRETAFTIEHEKRVMIGLALFERLDIAQRVCAKIISKYSECEVIAHSVEVNHMPSTTVADNRKRKNSR